VPNLPDQVQGKLADNTQGSPDEPHSDSRSLLAGKAVDEVGKPLVAPRRQGHDTLPLLCQPGTSAPSQAAAGACPRKIEMLVPSQFISAIGDPLRLIDTAQLDLAATENRHPTQQIQLLAARLRASPELFARLVERVTVA
jgi:hypothetical protein